MVSNNSNISLLQAIKLAFAKYIDFSDQATRYEAWYFILFFVLVSLSLLVLSTRYYIAFFVLTIIPYISLTARRFKDANLNPKALFVIIPLIFGIGLIAINIFENELIYFTSVDWRNICANLFLLWSVMLIVVHAVLSYRY